MSDTMTQAAFYYLRWIGKRGTQKQIDSLLRAVGPNVIRMAVERGFKLPAATQT